MTIANRYSFFLLGFALMIVFAIGMMGCGAHNDSDEPLSSIGQASEQEVPQQSAGSIDEGAIGKTISVEGEIVKQCPAVGCWFIVKDETGEVFVDLNPAKLHLEQKRVGQQVHVTGRVVKQGAQFRLEGQHVQFETKTGTVTEDQE